MCIWSDYFLRFEKNYLNHIDLFIKQFNNLNEENKKLKFVNQENEILKKKI